MIKKMRLDKFLCADLIWYISQCDITVVAGKRTLLLLLMCMAFGFVLIESVS